MTDPIARRPLAASDHDDVSGHAGDLLSPADTALLETLVLQAPVAFAFYGPDMRYRRINRMLAEINGLPMDAHIGYRPSELLGELGVKVEERLREVFDTGDVVTDDDFTATSPVTGELRHYQSQWFPARAEGEVIGVAVLVSDVTERRRADVALRRSVQLTAQLQRVTAALGEALTVADVRRVVAETAPSASGALRAELVLPGDRRAAAGGAGAGWASSWSCPAGRPACSSSTSPTRSPTRTSRTWGRWAGSARSRWSGPGCTSASAPPR